MEVKTYSRRERLGWVDRSQHTDIVIARCMQYNTYAFLRYHGIPDSVTGVHMYIDTLRFNAYTGTSLWESLGCSFIHREPPRIGCQQPGSLASLALQVIISDGKEEKRSWKTVGEKILKEAKHSEGQQKPSFRRSFSLMFGSVRLNSVAFGGARWDSESLLTRAHGRSAQSSTRASFINVECHACRVFLVFASQSLNQEGESYISEISLVSYLRYHKKDVRNCKTFI
ncbi:hypothetical protein V1478_017452 [Vespula squamosa]|uniref:Uncharacterized protein n=1 Tax=Vespula squamosa TaxID=30214 RepID=A0ABD1ZWW0_VESSQ